MFAQVNGPLRQLLREKEGRDAEPSACVIDAQSVKTSTSVHASSQGIDAGKKVVGRKRNIVTDTIGLLMAVLVTAATIRLTKCCSVWNAGSSATKPVEMLPLVRKGLWSWSTSATTETGWAPSRCARSCWRSTGPTWTGTRRS
nr:transposase [Streptomyces sp. NBC_00893]